MKKKNKKNKLKKVQPYSIEKQIPFIKRLNSKDKLSIFLGAGVSVSCGLPDWGALLGRLEVAINNYGVEVNEGDGTYAEVTTAFFSCT